VVVAQEGNAAVAGRDVMRRGGNAIDAAVATAFVLSATLPEAGNLGGGGFIVAYLPAIREVVTVDFRETAPASSTPRMYLDGKGELRPRHRAGAWAAGVPGTVRGLGLAHARWGKLPWAELVAPAARIAREGFAISAELAASLNDQLRPRTVEEGGSAPRGYHGRLVDFPESVAVYQRPDAQPWQAGDRLIQADLAATLDRIARGGPDEFYKGKTAELIAAYVGERDGFITRDDLAGYQAKERPPVKTSFRGHEIYGMGPPSSGGVVLCQMLNILERFDLKADGPRSGRTLHLITEAMRRAYFTRAERLADPDFVDVPTAELTSKAVADMLAESIGERATPSASLAPFPIVSVESNHTTHLSVLDGDGGAVALTYTLEDSYGSKAVVPGAGFLLNNEMGDFNLRPGRTDDAGAIGTPANLIAAGKRMLSSQCPALAIKDGAVRLVAGSPGGRTIPNTTLWVVLNVLEFGLAPREAVAAPRTHHAWFPDVLYLEGRDWPDAALKDLTARGHAWRTGGRQGVANSIVVDPDGLRHGVPDPRRATATASGD
jgi:gamma-glutamyltranspeptidase/glutathione hydrolase